MYTRNNPILFSALHKLIIAIIINRLRDKNQKRNKFYFLQRETEISKILCKISTSVQNVIITQVTKQPLPLLLLLRNKIYTIIINQHLALQPQSNFVDVFTVTHFPLHLQNYNYRFTFRYNIIPGTHASCMIHHQIFQRLFIMNFIKISFNLDVSKSLRTLYILYKGI